jgi:heme-degrading monooxygenase HmoA
MQIKPGKEQQLAALMKDFESARVPGFIAEYVYRMDADPNTYYLAVVFDSKESYWANARSPEQDARYRQMRELLESDPEWHDGEVAHTARGG